MTPAGDADAVVLVSGGLDSCVTLAEARREGARVAILHASYGQRTAEREMKAFSCLARHYDVPDERRRTLDLRFLGALGGSSLTDREMPVPDGHSEDGIPSTYVPFRNALLLAAAVSWAEVLGARSIWIGVVEEDGTGYPDCRDEFLDAFERAVRLGCAAGASMRIVRPLVSLGKGEIVRKGLDLDAPLHLTWSCYRSSRAACGRCESCLLRLAGFAAAGVPDPIPYASGEDRRDA